MAHVYHTVKHNMSYVSADCANKLLHWTVSDSNIVKKMSCGRTKAETIVKNILAPKSVSEVVNILKGSKPIQFSIQTDASNKGNQKMFPLSIQYFTPESGVTQKMIDFVENPNESADGIVACIENSLEQLSLTLDQVSAFSADNTNVNYGVHNSVYTKLKKKNSYLLTGNCHAHIVHNTVKHALDEFSVDVENVVLKIYAFFSSSAKRREKRKEFCEFCDVEFREFLRHVVTRWLSLNPAITRLMQNWTALKSYLISLGDDCPRHLRILLNLNMDAEELQEEGDVVEVYLLFCNNILSLFEEVVKNLEKDATTSVDLYAIMKSFMDKLIQRRDDEFYGYLTKLKLQRLPPSDANTAKKEFKAFLSTAIRYIKKWFDFTEDNWLFHLQPLSLRSEKIDFGDMEKVAVKLNLVQKLQINMDALYDECVTTNSILVKLREQDQWQHSDTAKKWMTVLQAADLPNILALVSFVLSIPSSTGYVERIFSIMKNKWSDSRNRCSVELMKSELLITMNFNQPCYEFYKTVLHDKQILAAVRSEKKYSWKK